MKLSRTHAIRSMCGRSSRGVALHKNTGWAGRAGQQPGCQRREVRWITAHVPAVRHADGALRRSSAWACRTGPSGALAFFGTGLSGGSPSRAGADSGKATSGHRHDSAAVLLAVGNAGGRADDHGHPVVVDKSIRIDPDEPVHRLTFAAETRPRSIDVVACRR